ncbi:MAG: SDR family NAD(P)-dependent oxidoreductase [Cellulosilyticaceae bacterium]
MKPIAVITGATSGIGKAYAYELAKQGYDLILTGRRETILRQVANRLEQKYGTQITVGLVDFSNEKAFKRFLKWLDSIKGIQMLINNAGYGAEHSFMEDSYEVQFNMVKVHVHASMALAHIIGNKMKQQGYGEIINVCSLAAYIPLPSSAMYAATKSFLITFSECLSMELREYGVTVQALCPGFVHTDFHAKLNVSASHLKNRGPVRFMTAEQVVNYSLKKLKDKNQVIVVPGRFNQLGYLLLRRIPKKGYYPVVRYGMKQFKK